MSTVKISFPSSPAENTSKTEPHPQHDNTAGKHKAWAQLDQMNSLRLGNTLLESFQAAFIIYYTCYFAT